MINSKHKGDEKKHLNSAQPKIAAYPFRSYIVSYLMDQTLASGTESDWGKLTPLSISIIDLEAPCRTDVKNNDSREPKALPIH